MDLNWKLQRYASEGDLPNTLKYLNMGANVNRRVEGETALHVVKTAECASALISYGADVNLLNNMGQTPLHTAKSAEISREFVLAGAILDFRDRKNHSPLHT